MRATNYNETKNEIVVIQFNVQNTEHKFIPAVVEVRCEAITAEGAVSNIKNSVEVGTPTETKLTLKQIYAAVNRTTTGGIIAGVMKSAFIEAVDEDVTV